MDSVEWRRNGLVSRRFASVWLGITLLFLVVVLAVDDVSSLTRLSAGLNVSAAVLILLGTRARVVADADGIEITGEVRTRRVPWGDVAALRGGRARWSGFVPVEMHLVDGSRRSLAHVPAGDLPRLEGLRALATE